MSTASDLIERLKLQPHPEGGWYAETWRAHAPDGERAGSTAIHFLLEAGQSSHWHRVDAAEIWLWHAGDPLQLSLCKTDAGPVETVTLGADILAGQMVQQVIPPHWWQAARPAAGPAGYVLVSCVVAPGFDFAGFELAAAGWRPGA
ncbi:cupin domain-containing protein [Erythrobacter sp. SDW2]|uniref:cupin domain-containing protein n=1 Tax=Erythrobacter sp. SDW2 TaxID=2907154 RepID=UPI001F24DA0C|nr:cupin domain-containing protein [Erythrobacter sp. SDW2]UIP07745.1 cupin domain-containing protein [Erythrobacter sp. SDW2]